jgi:hypothetical protein
VPRSNTFEKGTVSVSHDEATSDQEAPGDSNKKRGAGVGGIILSAGQTVCGFHVRHTYSLIACDDAEERLGKDSLIADLLESVNSIPIPSPLALASDPISLYRAFPPISPLFLYPSLLSNNNFLFVVERHQTVFPPH